MSRRLGSRFSWRSTAVASAAAGLFVSSTFAAVYSNTNRPQYGIKAEVGGKIRNFYLPDVKGNLVALTDFESSPLKVLFFAGLDSATTDAYWDDLKALNAKFAQSGAQFVVIFSDTTSNAELVSAKVKSLQLDFPVLIDNKQRVAWRYGVKTTPEALLVDEHRVVRYRGRIDNQFAQGEEASVPRAHLELAMAELAAKTPVSVATAPVVGTPLAPRTINLTTPPTYSGQVASILQDNCQTCHREGGIGPMKFDGYQAAKMWGPSIKQAVLDDRMPPWYADPRTDHKWTNDRRLNDETIDTLVSWIDSGMPEGDPALAPPKKEIASGRWRAGATEPDIVFELPEEITLPASGSIPYMNPVTPTNFTEDVWVTAVEAQPDNATAVHHIIVYVRAPRGGADGASGSGAGVGAQGFLDAFAPGDMPLIMRDGAARRIPAGSSLTFQMHYTATGKVEKDRSRIGLYVAKEAPLYESITANATNARFRLPAGSDNVEVVSEYTFREDARLDSLMPHMHVRGKSFRYTAVYPDGTKSVLLNVPQYDFNWQLTYELAEHPVMPAGTKLFCEATFDNSVYNYANPDPTEEVRWGNQTWEEMMIGWFDYTSVKTIAERTALTKGGADLVGPDQLQQAEHQNETPATLP